MAGAGQRHDLDLHQPFSGKSDHLEQEGRRRGPSPRAYAGPSYRRSSVVSLVKSWMSQPDLNWKSSVTSAMPLPRYSDPMGALARGLAPISYTTTGDTTFLALDQGALSVGKTERTGSQSNPHQARAIASATGLERGDGESQASSTASDNRAACRPPKGEISRNQKPACRPTNALSSPTSRAMTQMLCFTGTGILLQHIRGSN